MPELNTVGFSVTFLPNSLAKNPFASPTSAGSCVMLAWKPSRSTTGAPADPVADAELHPAAAIVIAATRAVTSAFRIYSTFPINLIGKYATGDRRMQLRWCYGVALTRGAGTWCPRNSSAATWVSVCVPSV